MYFNNSLIRNEDPVREVSSSLRFTGRPQVTMTSHYRYCSCPLRPRSSDGRSVVIFVIIFFHTIIINYYYYFSV